RPAATRPLRVRFLSCRREFIEMPRDVPLRRGASIGLDMIAAALAHGGTELRPIEPVRLADFAERGLHARFHAAEPTHIDMRGAARQKRAEVGGTRAHAIL